MDELTAKLILIRAPITGAQWFLLHEKFGTAADFISAGRSAWEQCQLTARSIDVLSAASESLVIRDIEWLQQDKHYLIHLGDADYPPLLRHLPDAPVCLYVSGNAQLLSMPQLAMVGSRNPSHYGREVATAFAK